MPVTQKDIAHKLNLSQSLVARVLNNRSGVWASDDTRRRIHEAARDLNYQPHVAAKALRSGKSNLVAHVFLGSRENVGLMYGCMVEALARSLCASGFGLLAYAFEDKEQFMTHLHDLSQSRSCAAVALMGPFEALEEAGDLLSTLGMPFVLPGRFEVIHPDWPQVDFDHEGMMAKAVCYLRENGHKRIACTAAVHLALRVPPVLITRTLRLPR